jgi:hypothetical protein
LQLLNGLGNVVRRTDVPPRDRTNERIDVERGLAGVLLLSEARHISH